MTFIGTQGFAVPGTAGVRGGQPAWAGGLNVAGHPLGGYGGTPVDVHPFEAAAPNAPHAVLTPYQAAPEVEARAAVGFLQDACADLIRKLYHYVEANSPQFPQLLDCVPLVQHAAELYGAREYTSAFSQAYQAYRAIAILHATVPGLPNLS